MAEDAKIDEMIEELRAAFCETIRIAVSGMPAHGALQLADALCSTQLVVLAGMRVTYRARPAVDAEALTEDWRRGLSIREITKKHGVSRAVAYRLHPAKSTRRARAG